MLDSVYLGKILLLNLTDKSAHMSMKIQWSSPICDR